MEAFKFCVAVLLLMLIAASVRADVNISNAGDTWKVTANKYEVSVASDGCLTSLRTGWVEFLCSGVADSRGAFFITDRPLVLPNITKDASDTLTASGPEAKLTWQFFDDHIRFTVVNMVDKDMYYRMVIYPGIRFVNIDGGKYKRLPFRECPVDDCSWVVGSSIVDIKGGTKIWGPWYGESVIWELLMRGVQTRIVDMSFADLNDAVRSILDNAEAGKPPYFDALSIFSPQEARVFQRQSRYKGFIDISGRANVDCDGIEYKVVGKPLRGSIAGNWKKAKLDPITKGFSEKIDVPAGGWYSLHVRLLKKGKVVFQKKIDKFGVGEVFVGAGQSNSTNCGQFRTKQVSGMVSCCTGFDWQIRDDPFIGPHDPSVLGSVYPSFGDLMYEKYHVPIGIASTGHGGTSVIQWYTGGELFNWTMDRIHYLGPRGFRAVMWHQGEADAGMSSDEYFQRMSRLINDTDVIAGWSIPWFVVQASYADPYNSSFPKVREGQRRLWESKTALEGPDTDKLTKKYRDFDGHGVHFNPDGLKAMAKMWFDKISPYIDSVLGD